MRHLKHAFFVLVFASISTALTAQCTPDSSVSGLFTPNFDEGLPNGQIGANYEATITLNVPADTTYLTLTAVIDSMVLTDVTGLPPGFDYSCVPPSCGFAGGELGCVLISGITNDNAHAVTWDIEGSFQFYLKSPAVTLPYTLEGYSITLDSGVASGIEDRAQEALKMYIEPNPIRSSSEVVFDLPGSSAFSLDIYSLLGKRVAHLSDRGTRGENRLRIADMVKEPGVYFITVNQGSYARSMRFIVQ